MYEIFEYLLQKHGVTTYQVAKATGISQSTFSNWKSRRNLLSPDKAKLIADYFGVTLDYLMTGKKETNDDDVILSLKDERDITNDLRKMMANIRNDKDGPLYYNGEEIDETSLILLENALEHAMRETKKINKQRFGRRKDPKQVVLVE